MSSTPKSTMSDPYIVLPKERARYEEQFKSLKPINGIVTGEQAKGFFLQSQLSPYVLGQIWAIADTDSDGKMDFSEFSIACKLINLKIRGFDVPKTVPPSLLSSLKSTPPAIPPLPNSTLINAPPRPEPPKVAPLVQQPPIQPVISNQMLLQNSQPTIGSSNMGMGTEGMMLGSIPVSSMLTGSPSSGIPTGIVPPMPTNIQPTLISGIPPIQPLTQPAAYSTPLVPGGMTVPLASTAPLVPGIHSASNVPVSTVAPMAAMPSITPLPSAIPMSVPASMSPVGVVPCAAPAGPGATSTPRGSIPSLDRTHSIESMSSQPEWAVPHSTKLKYTQIFNTTDRTKSGFLSGAQARNVMVQTKLPQGILAQIWALADMDADGRLGCEEFVLAMYLCEQAQLGHPPPTKLPLDLIPPSFRRSTRTASISSQGSGVADQDPASTLLQNSFEDKRKENFEKGQAELERRRKTLLDQQRQEREERERKEREEQEKKEKARQEAERKRLDELERQMREQQEKERQMEEERKRQAEQREAARKEMERQRQLEWEKQRLQELQQQRQREQENVLKLKAKNQSLTIELTSLNDQVKELSQKICDTRMGVSNVKSTIDGMRSTRDSQMQEMAQLKNKLKEQNAKLLSLSQEKLKLEARNKINSQDSEQARIAFENKEVTIKNLRKKVEDMEAEIDNKLIDIENNNSQLSDLQHQMKELIKECEQLYTVYELKRDTVLEMKNVNKGTDFDVWKSTDAWGPAAAASEPESWPVENWSTTAETVPVTSTTPEGMVRYRALYEFVARTADEISFQPGDIINVPSEQTGEPGWLAGEIRGKTGWFPESYVEPVDGISVRDDQTAQLAEDIEAKRLEGIAEVPEGSEVNNSIEPVLTQPKPEAVLPESEPEYYVANYAYQSEEAGDLTFNAGDVITVLKQEGDWWTGKLGDNVGLFPSNYVQKVEMTTNPPAEDVPVAAVNSTSAVTTTVNNVGVSAEAVESALEYANAQVDNEVNQINQNKSKELPFDAAVQANAQTVKSKKPEIASVIAAYQSTSPEQLSLARGQLIMIRKKTNSGWWEGELQAKGRKRQVGWFPASYVKVLSSSGRASGRTTPVSSTRMQQEVVIDKVIALYSYTAHHPDELTFAKDDIISVTAREEELWWRGELNGVSGMFPSNYVAPLQQQQ